MKINKLRKIASLIRPAEMWVHVKVFFAMFSSVFRREYKYFPWKATLGVLLATIYLVSPIDLLPDFIVAIGWLDDLTVVLFCAHLVGNDLEKFSNWRANQKKSLDNFVEDSKL